MKVRTDDGIREYPEGISLARWTQLEQIRNPEVAILHVNDRVIPPASWESTLLQEGDRIQLLYFLGDS